MSEKRFSKVITKNRPIPRKVNIKGVMSSLKTKKTCDHKKSSFQGNINIKAIMSEKRFFKNKRYFSHVITKNHPFRVKLILRKL